MKKIASIAAVTALVVGAILALPAQASAGAWSCRNWNSSWKWGGNSWNNHNDWNDWEEEENDWEENDWDGGHGDTSINEDNDTVVVAVSSNANVHSKTVSKSETGNNKQSWNDDNNHLTTGAANSHAESVNIVNSTSVDIQVD